MSNINSPRVKWTLVDSRHPRFNLWKSIFGYCEGFPKRVDPNLIIENDDNDDDNDDDNEELDEDESD